MNTVNTPSGLTPESFQSLTELVRDRGSNADFEAILKDNPTWASAWALYQGSVDRDVADINSAFRFLKPEEYERRVFARTLRGRWSRYQPQSTSRDVLLTPELAIILGELERLSVLSAEELREEKLGDVELEPTVASLLGDARHLAATYPFLATASDVLMRHPRPKKGEGLPVETVLGTIENLQRLHEKLGLKESATVRKNVGSIAAWLGRVMGTPAMLSPEYLPESFERAYEKHWHTSAKTKSATGAFVDVVRDRARTEGTPGLLITLAASSDGRNRRIAGHADATPEAVYDKLVYDNSLNVLYAVVESRHFTQYKAAAMIDTGLAKQIVAVMLNSRARTRTGSIDKQIRYTACERAIAHEGVDPLYVYQFLHGHSHNEDFPTYLWPDFVKELSRRYDISQMHGDEKAQENFKSRLTRFSNLFMEEELKPYWEAQKKVAQGEAMPSSTWAQRAAREGQEYMAKHEHLKDPSLWAILVEGCADGKQLVEMLRFTKESGLPLSKELMVKVFTHPEGKVREQGITLLPNIRPEDIEQAQVEIDTRVAENRAHLKDKVFNSIIPDYEPIEGEPRLLSRMHHFFMAAKELDAEELEKIFIRCAESDPRTIPEKFQERTEMLRLSKGMMSTVDAASSDEDVMAQAQHFATPAEQSSMFSSSEVAKAQPQEEAPAEKAARKAHFSREAQQSDLFGDLASARPSGKVEKPAKSRTHSSR